MSKLQPILKTFLKDTKEVLLKVKLKPQLKNT
jgi:hypothetical protein